MIDQFSWKEIVSYFDDDHFQTVFSIFIIFLFLISRWTISVFIERHAKKQGLSHSRVIYMRKLINSMILIVTLTTLGFLWEVSLKGLSIYFASIFTVIGVALFATWSILSNLTASIILFFFYPYRIGDRIRIQDGENSVEGTVLDISLFYMRIDTVEGKTIIYPNNLVIQKPILNTEKDSRVQRNG